MACGNDIWICMMLDDTNSSSNTVLALEVAVLMKIFSLFTGLAMISKKVTLL